MIWDDRRRRDVGDQARYLRGPWQGDHALDELVRPWARPKPQAKTPPKAAAMVPPKAAAAKAEAKPKAKTKAKKQARK